MREIFNFLFTLRESKMKSCDKYAEVIITTNRHEILQLNKLSPSETIDNDFIHLSDNCERFFATVDFN